MDPFSLTIGAISVVAVALHSARRCKELIDSIIDGPRQLMSARRDIVTYHDLLSSIEAFARDYKFPTNQAQERLISELMMGLEPLLKEDVQTLGKVEELVRKYTKPSAEVGKIRWSNFKALLGEKELAGLMERVRYEETTLTLVMTTLNSVQGMVAQDLLETVHERVGSVEDLTAGLKYTVVKGREVDNETNSIVNKMSLQVDQLTKKLVRVNSLELSSPTASVELQRPDLQRTLSSFVGKSGREGLKGRKPFRESDMVAYHPTDASIYDGKWSVPSFYTPIVAVPVIFEFTDEEVAEVNLAARKGLLEDVAKHLSSPFNSDSGELDGRTALHEAAAAGHVDIVKLLLSNHFIVESADESGNTPLHYAAYFGHKLVVECLLQAGADVNSQNNILWTALHFASYQGYDSIVSILIQPQYKTKLNLPGPVFITALMWATDNADSATLKALLQAGADPNCCDRDGQTALHHASARGFTSIMQLLLDKGADSEIKRKNDARPIHIAAQYGQAEAIRILLDNGADPNANVGDGWCPLHFAAARGHVPVVETLLERRWRTDIEKRGTFNKTALIWAAEVGQNSSVRALLARGANPNARDMFAESGLHYASTNGYLDIVVQLVDAGCDVRGRNSRGHTPLHKATDEYGSVYPSVKFLVERGAEVDATDGWGNTALHYAAGFGNKRQVWYLLKSKASTSIVNQEGKDAAEVASAKGHEDVAEVIRGFEG